MRQIDEPLTADKRFAEIAQILAAGVLRLRTWGGSSPSPAHESASEKPSESASHVLEPSPRQSVIHHAG
jgi:hypothetical protein